MRRLRGSMKKSLGGRFTMRENMCRRMMRHIVS